MVNMSAGLAHADISVLWAIFFLIPTYDFYMKLIPLLKQPRIH